MARCQDPGASEAEQRALYERFRSRVYGICFRLTGNDADALDASQETFRTIFSRIETFEFRSRFSSWVYRIAVNTSLDLRRGRGRWRAFSFDAEPDRAPIDASALGLRDRFPGPVATAVAVELEGAVKAAVERLPPKLRGVTVLRYFEGLAYEEIAAALELSLGTVKSRLWRAHAALDRSLGSLPERHGVPVAAE